jgi:Family of unknown function (DUF5309)
MAIPYSSTVTAGALKGTLSSNFLQTDLAKKSFAATIARLMPNGTATLFGLTALLGDETAVAYEHGYFAKTMIFPSVTLTANAPTVGTSVANSVQENITVGSTANIVTGMILQVMLATGVPTGENLLVLAVVSSTVITVNRNIGGVVTLGAALTSGLVCYQVGTAYEEASTRPTALGIVPVRITNLTQIFRNTWTISDSVRATQTIAGDSNVAENRMDCMAFHASDIEKALFFGYKSFLSVNNQPMRTMDGLVSILGNAANYPPIFAGGTNVVTAGATTTNDQLEVMLDPVFNQATDPRTANERLLFVGGNAKRVLNGIGKKSGTYYLVDSQTSWGLQFTEYHSTRGNFKVIEHPLFNSNTAWSKMAVCVDPASIRLAYLGDRKTQNREFNVNMKDVDPIDNGVDAVGGTLTTECTLIVKNPAANAIIYNLTAAA